MSNPPRKNDEFDLTITDLTAEGAGIGRLNGFALFVPGTLPGEAVRARAVKVGKAYGFAKALAILSPSPHRVAPPCPAAATCGGCSLQHMAYEGQLFYKQKRVEDSLTRIGGFDRLNVRPIIGGEPLAYRNKAQFPVRVVNDKPEAGFYAVNSHRLTPLNDCPLQARPAAPYIAALKAYMNEAAVPCYDEQTHTGVMRHLLLRFSEHGTLACAVINAHKPPAPERLLAAFPADCRVAYNVNKARGNVILGQKTVALRGAPYLDESLCGLTLRVDAGSFFQVNRPQAERLYAAAMGLASIQPGDTVADAYCGVGGLALLAARTAARAYGIEIAEAAIANAEHNAQRNGITNASFITASAADGLRRLSADGVSPAVIIVDPPRAGCDEETLAAVSALSPARIVYVSCDPGTLARDLKRLCAGGAYRPAAVQPVDMFPQTMHVEAAALLTAV